MIWGENPLFLETPISTTNLAPLVFVDLSEFWSEQTNDLDGHANGGMKKLSFPRWKGGIVKVNGGWGSGRIHRLVWQILSLSHEKKPLLLFHWNPGWLIRILIMVYYNPYITGKDFIPYITQPTRVFFIAHLTSVFFMAWWIWVGLYVNKTFLRKLLGKRWKNLCP